jgi:hypothetical protein
MSVASEFEAANKSFVSDFKDGDLALPPSRYNITPFLLLSPIIDIVLP